MYLYMVIPASANKQVLVVWMKFDRENSHSICYCCFIYFFCLIASFICSQQLKKKIIKESLAYLQKDQASRQAGQDRKRENESRWEQWECDGQETTKQDIRNAQERYRDKDFNIYYRVYVDD